MQRFLVLYESSVPAAEMMAAGTPEEMQAGMEAWMQWAGRCGDALVDLGSPLRASTQVTASGTGNGSGVVGGFSILQGDSMDQVTKLLEGHPHFMGPGETSISVMEFMPPPGM
jgi:hypothetical protein